MARRDGAFGEATFIIVLSLSGRLTIPPGVSRDHLSGLDPCPQPVNQPLRLPAVRDYPAKVRHCRGLAPDRLTVVTWIFNEPTTLPYR